MDDFEALEPVFDDVPYVDIEEIQREDERALQERQQSLYSNFYTRARAIEQSSPVMSAPAWLKSGTGSCLFCGRQTTKLCFHLLVPQVNHIFNRVVSCVSCHQSLGSGDWIEHKVSRSAHTKQQLKQQREKVLALQENHCLPLEKATGDGLRKKALAIYQKRWAFPRIQVFAGAYGFNKSTSLITFKRGQYQDDAPLVQQLTALAKETSEADGWFTCSFVPLLFDEAIRLLISRNALVTAIDLSDIHFHMLEQESRWPVQLSGERWIKEFVQFGNKKAERKTP